MGGSTPTKDVAQAKQDLAAFGYCMLTESTDYRHLRTHVNKQSAKRNSDGSVTITVARRDPGASNFIDTAGHRTGTMLLRWVSAARHPIPHCRVVKLGGYSQVIQNSGSRR
jgi:hypothetical protein